MARVEMDDFVEGVEIIRVYLAASLNEATRVEGVLDSAGISYGVELETLVGSDGFGLRTERSAAGFWVDAGGLQPAYDALFNSGLIDGLVRLETPT